MHKVMVFGVFDGLHDGHREFFRQAKKCGDYLIAVVAQDAAAENLKGRRPRSDLNSRLKEIKKEDVIDQAVAGDSQLGIWQVIKNHKPDVIALGYDQNILREDLENRLDEFDWRPKIKIMSAYQAKKYHNSKLKLSIRRK